MINYVYAIAKMTSPLTKLSEDSILKSRIHAMREAEHDCGARRRSRHAVHSESAEIGVAGRALVLSLRDSNRQRTINSGGERDEDARSIRKWGKEERLDSAPFIRCGGCVRFVTQTKFAFGSAAERKGERGLVTVS